MSNEVEMVCGTDGAPCLTCGDVALPAEVIQVDEARAMARVEIEGRADEVDISLLEAVEVGQLLLVHGGVALERMREAPR